jgi:hypothetical protein
MNTRTLNIMLLAALAAIGRTAGAGSVESVPPRQLEEERGEREAYRALLDMTMSREGRDAKWASEVEEQIRASLDSVTGLDVTTRSIGCAATLCRVILDHATLSGQQEVLDSTAGLPGFNLPGQAHLEWSDDGSAVTYIYLLRFDTDWPEVLTP